jgi:tetratricopeptide (TPR) repeat protein
MTYPFDQHGHTVRGRIGTQLRRLALSVAITAVWAVPAAMAQANEYAEVNRLVRAGQLNEALAKADQFLVNRPRDPQMRFLKGVIQTESGKPNDAIATFNKLSGDFPELPEPYNNLAVLYASQSQFDKARAALEMAIRTNPSYATAHENLGDVYAKLASEAYSKALQLDTSNAAVEPKLSLIRNLFTTDNKGGGGNISTTVAVATTTKPTTPTVAPTTPAVTTPPVTNPATTTPTTTPVVTPAPVKPTTLEPATTPTVVEQDAVEAAVMAWAKAWSSKNMTGYLGAYGSGFTPPAGQSRSQWEADRKARIVPRAKINVEVTDLAVTVNGNRATARFRQNYSSDTLSVNSRKTLDMVKSDNRWLIVRESTGS